MMLGQKVTGIKHFPCLRILPIKNENRITGVDMHLCNCFVVKWSGVQEGSVHVKNDMGDLAATAPLNMLAENGHPSNLTISVYWNLDLLIQIFRGI